MSLKNTVVFITGGSRGIGEAIAIRLAKEGASIAIAAKTADPNPKLPGTIYSAAKAIEAAGGKALPLQCDIRDEHQVKAAIDRTVETFGHLDVVINNASAIFLKGTLETDPKRYDLMHDINGRGTWLVTKLAIPHLIKSKNPRVLTLSPPLDIKQKWFGTNPAYTMAKYNMSMLYGIAVNGLWPYTVIETAALNMISRAKSRPNLRTPEIMADAALEILQKPASFTGNICIDEIVLREAGITDMGKYALTPGTKDEDMLLDGFLSEEIHDRIHLLRGQRTPPAKL
ncbi:short-chain dehydrogenase/reductase SDR [Linderina pennispora]|uniref:Hydroxysteroid dehydrogenase-like protein 2 n=1 Tax=Linderina pennispora TaxID=61395 RepID=A0A1Y1VYB5_9FUNG|nr:short-chain dehydrogenase/reductase SDR [Linderina pennispora]ORX66261.1 short-chain dehydrogenase/reductase SDR [Linderina pennispora]